MANTHRERWTAWRAISDRIVADPQYRYPCPRLLMNLSRFAQSMMGVHNTAYWQQLPNSEAPDTTIGDVYSPCQEK